MLVLTLGACAGTSAEKATHPAAVAPVNAPASASAPTPTAQLQDADIGLLDSLFIDEKCIVSPRPVTGVVSTQMIYDYEGKAKGSSPFAATILPEGQVRGNLQLGVWEGDLAKVRYVDLDEGNRYRLEVTWDEANTDASVQVWEQTVTGTLGKALLKFPVSSEMLPLDATESIDAAAAKIANYMPHVFGSAHEAGLQYVYVQVAHKDGESTAVPRWIRLVFKRK